MRWSREASQSLSSGRASAEAAAACLGSHRVGPVLNQVLSSRRSLHEPVELSRPLSAPAPASAGQQCSMWRETARRIARNLAAAASEQKMNLLRVFLVLPVVFLALLSEYQLRSWMTHLKIEEDSIAQLVILHKAVSELRTQQDCYQMPDWARKSNGATIQLQRTSPTYECDSWFCWLKRFIVPVNPPDTILQPGISPGECWPMQGHQGQVVIRLPAKILPSCLTLQHVDPELTPAGFISSAPRQSAVFGLDVDGEEEVPLGSFTFNVHKAPLQTFLLQNNHARAFRYIKVLVKSNWGHPEHTCIYQVQVHGKVVEKNGLLKLDF
ncbi:sperm-associated antigen 4 protein-like isoform X3 [Phasianus colchicus]|uniref:sperm-associated antigen 4 protein-like isoform X3 n=1 Tax=Phasianus colchicus TaxID=9054 RepID=UPI00129E4AE6|nr:sperm-associated antigen 4 protein-like isoform X3 [Phasianus colchicus]